MDLLSTITSQMPPGAVGNIARQIGADEDTTRRTISAALPILVGALARNANQSKGGAESLTQALEKDHDGSLLDGLGGLLGGGTPGRSDLGGALGGILGGGASGSLGGILGGLLGGGGRATNGSGILEHILGGKRGAVEDGLSRATGMDRGKIMQLLLLLAPIVMSALGKMRRERGLGPDGVAEALRKEEEAVAEQAPGVNKKRLVDFLDTDNDGSVADEVAKLGAILGGAVLYGKLTKQI